MPRFQINSPDGVGYVLHSSDPDTIGRWFTETMSRFSGYFGSSAYNQFHMQVWPLYKQDPQGNREVPDWCVNSAHGWCHDFRFDGTMQGLISVLTAALEESKVDP